MRPLDRKLVGPPAEESEVAEGGATARQPREKPGVLVVDDAHIVRVMVQLGLERNGFGVWLASGGREAIRLYRGLAEDGAMTGALPAVDEEGDVMACVEPQTAQGGKWRHALLSLETGPSRSCEKVESVGPPWPRSGLLLQEEACSARSYRARFGPCW
jgi:hypothetical protein